MQCTIFENEKKNIHNLTGYKNKCDDLVTWQMKGYETIPSALFAVNFCKWTNTVEILTFLMEQGIINPYTQFT